MAWQMGQKPGADAGHLNYNWSMPPAEKRFPVRRLIGILILLVSLCLLVWGLWPLQDAIRTVPVPPQNMSLPDSSSLIPALLPFWSLRPGMEWAQERGKESG